MHPSTPYEITLPNVLAFTFAGVRMVSARFWPVRALSFRVVRTEGTVTATLVTVTDALALLLASSTLVAVTVCWPAADGAVYTPLVEIIPAEALPPLVPSTDQVTPVLAVPVTTAWKGCC